MLKLKKDDELEEMFIEFYEAFPNSVPDGRGGRRVLKAKSHESRDFEVARRKYMTLVRKNPVIHRSIMKGLAKQKEQVSKLQFMNAIEISMDWSDEIIRRACLYLGIASQNQGTAQLGAQQ